MNTQISKTTTAIWVWGICFFCLLVCGVIFWVLTQASSLPDFALLVYPLLALVALGALSYLVSTPLTYASVNADGEVTFTWQYLLYRERKVFHASLLADPTLEEYDDSDDDSTWSVKLLLPDNSEFRIADYGIREGSGRNEKTKKRCEARRAQFMESISHYKIDR